MPAKTLTPYNKILPCLVPPCLIIVTGIAVYSNSFSAPFFFDAPPCTIDNPHIRSLWPIWEAMQAPPASTTAARPVINLSLAFNYALGELNVWGYHAFNLAVHILAALILYGIVRRTLLLDKLHRPYDQHANPLAMIIALIWLVHPLQTECVTYISTRTESMMGLFYLLPLYFSLRSFKSTHWHRWYAAAMIFCALGMGSKEVMVSAPLMVLVYDRTFNSGSFKVALRNRWGLYSGLAASWSVIAILTFTAYQRMQYSNSMGFHFEHLQPLDYLKTQSAVITHYLTLVFWPGQLVVDYSGWPIARSISEIWPQACIILLMLGGSLFSFRTRPALFFLGMWFFLILAPTSSILPLVTEIAAERRMYLPLASIVIFIILSVYVLLCRLQLRYSRPFFTSRNLILPLAAMLVLTLGFLTFQRNKDYQSHLTIWSDTVVKRPNNHRARNNLGKVLTELGNIDLAMKHFQKGLKSKPDSPKLLANIGITYYRKGQYEQALEHFQRALNIQSDLLEVRDLLGNALLKMGRVDQAVKSYRRTLEIAPNHAKVHYYLAQALDSQGQTDEALQHYAQFLKYDPQNATAHVLMGRVLARLEMNEEAIIHFRKALQIDPDEPKVHYNLGRLLARQGDQPQAIRHYLQSLQAKPEDAVTHYYLARAWTASQNLDKALEHFRQAVRYKPGFAEAHNQIGRILNSQGYSDQALNHLRQAIRIRPDYADAYYNLANALLLEGNTEEAIENYQHALKIKPDYSPALRALKKARSRLPGNSN